MSRRRFETCLVAILFCWVTQAAWSADPLKFTLLSDSAEQPGLADVLSQINTIAGGPGEFLVTAGDMHNMTDNRVRIDAAFGTNFPWYNTSGNHERDEDKLANNILYMHNLDWNAYGRPVNPGPIGGEKTTYSFDAGPVHIVMLNVYYDSVNHTDYIVDTIAKVQPAMRNWLANDLGRTTKKWKLVVGHAPAWSYCDEYDGGRRRQDESLDTLPAARDAFWSLLNQYNVTAYICGHTHKYSRVKPLSQGGKVWQINDGIAGDYRADSGNHSTWIIVTASDSDLHFDTYRDLGDPNHQHTLVDSWSIMNPSRAPLPERAHSPGTLVGTYRYVGGPLPNRGPDAGRGAGPFRYDAKSAFGDEGGRKKFIEWTTDLPTDGVTVEFDLGNLYPITEVSSLSELPSAWYGLEGMRVSWSADGVSWSKEAIHLHRVVGEFNKVYTVSEFRAMDGSQTLDHVTARFFRIHWPKNDYLYGHESIRINEVYFRQSSIPKQVSPGTTFPSPPGSTGPAPQG